MMAAAANAGAGMNLDYWNADGNTNKFAVKPMLLPAGPSEAARISVDTNVYTNDAKK